MPQPIRSIGDLILTARALTSGAGHLTEPEIELLIAHYGIAHTSTVATFRRAILAGQDPLGDAFASLVSPKDRREHGQTYTPGQIVKAMIAWAADQTPAPVRIVDPGAGSGRYILAALRAFPEATGIASDIDPLAAIMLRANAEVLGFTDRLQVALGDYRSLALPEVTGPTLYVGNPPYVRHHQIDSKWKQWLTRTAAKHGVSASQLAGLHAHFILATAEHARPGDLGAFITSSEWLDVNYGKLIRELLLGELGGVSLHIIDPTSAPFADAQTTGAIAAFKVGSQPETIRIQQVKDTRQLGKLNAGTPVARARLAEANRWSVITRVDHALPDGFIELGELIRVHRGAVTGANKVWVTTDGAGLPEAVLQRSVTKARELFAAGDRLTGSEQLKMVIDLPVDLDALDADDKRRVQRFLRKAKDAGAADGFVATNRRAWWSVGLRRPAPILATYMARRPPAFVMNEAQARHINIAHGLYPRQPMADQVLDRLAHYLRTAVTIESGRTYAGGLTKFEPKEMERLAVPAPHLLEDEGYAAHPAAALV